MARKVRRRWPGEWVEDLWAAGYWVQIACTVVAIAVGAFATGYFWHGGAVLAACLLIGGLILYDRRRVRRAREMRRRLRARSSGT